jgi:flagellar basal body-associated protein FliL
MKISGRDMLNMPVEKIQKMFDSFTSATNSKVFSRDEERELKAQTLSFMAALKKCGNGHLVSPEMKPIVKAFEKADYDITKLPSSLRMSYEKTYFDLKNVLNEHGGEFKNTAVSLYCKAYEFLADKSNQMFINKLRKDPLAKKNKLTTEGLYDLESLEYWLQDNSEQSQEAGMMTALGSLSAGINGLSAAMPIVITILAVILICVTAFCITMTIINLKYKAELNKILVKITEDDVNKEGAENIKKNSRYNAAKSMQENTSPLTKNTFYKPMDFAVSGLQRITGSRNATKYIENLMNQVKKNKSTEGYERSQEGAIVAIPIIIGIICLLMCMKSIVYFIYNLRMKISVFFEEEATMLEINIEELNELKNNAVSDSEKARIEKIIGKQKKAMLNMSALSNFFYKQTNEAAMKTREDIDDNDNIPYDNIIDKDEGIRTEDTGDISDQTIDSNTPYETTDGATQQPSGTPVVLF